MHSVIGGRCDGSGRMCDHSSQVRPMQRGQRIGFAPIQSRLQRLLNPSPGTTMVVTSPTDIRGGDLLSISPRRSPSFQMSQTATMNGFSE